MLQVEVGVCRATKAVIRVVSDTRVAHFVCIAHVEMELAEHKHVRYYDE
jgi:hypothetical protein